MSNQRLPKGMNTGKKINPKSLLRVIKLLCSFYPVLVPVVGVCIVLSSVVSSIPSIFLQKIIAVIERYIDNGALRNAELWKNASGEIIPLVLILVSLYVVSIALMTV